MTRIVLRAFLALLLLTGLQTSLAAQFVNKPSTGCAGPMSWTGTPTIGTTPVLYSPCPPGMPCVLIIGSPIPCMNVVPLCATCNLCCWPIFLIAFVTPSGVPLPIPNNTNLIGFTGCMQTACLTTSGCYKTSDWISFTIQ